MKPTRRQDSAVSHIATAMRLRARLRGGTHRAAGKPASLAAN